MFYISGTIVNFRKAQLATRLPMLSQTVAETPIASLNCELPTLLIVGDPNRLNVAREALVELELGWEVVFAGSAFDALDVPAVRNMDVILVDLGNPHIEAVELVESLHTQFPQTPIVLMSAPFAVSVALECLRKGASNHFPRDLLDTEPAAVLETLRAAARDHQRRRGALARLDNQFFEFTLHNDRTDVPAVAARLADAAIETGLCDRAAGTRITVAIEECLLNAIIHGNLGVSSELRQQDEAAFYREIEARRKQAPYADRRVKLTARISPKEAIFVVQDEGAGFDAASIPDPTDPANLFRVGGRGILLMRSFMNAVHFADGGRRVTLVRRRS
jgi:CheY-like chemotaxis protein/anti-sigma regulatory factor (Ser/Thr protein kinase)